MQIFLKLITITKLSKFIETRTDQKYVIVQKDFIKDISKQLFNNTMHIFDMNRFFNEAWDKIIRTNQNTADKWKETLKIFEG